MLDKIKETSTKMCYPICREYKTKGGIIMLKFQTNHTTTIETFEDFILIIFVMIDDLYQRYAPVSVSSRRHVKDAKLSDSEIIDSENAWFSFVKKNYKHLVVIS